MPRARRLILMGLLVILVSLILMLLLGSARAQDECWPTDTPTPTKSTAVELSRFEAQGNEIIWETSMEIDTVGFHVLRSFSETGTYTRVNDTLVPASSPGGVFGGTYAFTDGEVCEANPCYYKLQEVEVGGSTNLYGPIDNGIRGSATDIEVTNVDASQSEDYDWVAIVLFLIALVFCAMNHTKL